MMKYIAPVLTVALVACGQAETSATLETARWSGTGTLYTTQGKALGDYRVNLDRTDLGAGAHRHDVEILREGAEPMLMTQTMRESDGAFSIDSEAGKGGGFDLGDGMVTTYTEGTDGLAYASVIVLDGDEDMRVLRFELREGQAQKIFKEVYARR